MKQGMTVQNYFFYFLRGGFFLCFLTAFFLGCTGASDIEEEDPQRLRRTDNSESLGRCRESSDSDLSIVTADDISSKNAGRYELSGFCPASNNRVEVRVDRGEVEINCSGGQWKKFLDVTSIVQDREEVQVSVSSGSDSDCVSVRNNFLCPNDYIPVPRLSKDRDIDLDYDFCVMKYEARSETNRRSSYRDRSGGGSFLDRDNSRRQEDVREEYNEKAVSKSSGDPWVDISRAEAERRCSNNGSGYRLISNMEWQNIARNIELVSENWSLEHTEIEVGNYLNRGSFDLGGFGSSRSSGGGGGGSRWDDEKQTHILFNEEEIWDFSGGVWEMVSDSVSSLRADGMRSTDDRAVYELTGNNKKLFGPKRDYLSVGGGRTFGGDSFRNVGLGGVELSNIEDVVARGGASSRDAGVFAVNARIKSGGYSSAPIGFRCVYIP